ncbi:hypothetical protein MKW98_021751 [Papaver atlanticum]|uniref:Uncharacterized protein n=1 Tax=Papaver atlanticum TaxID=357466 RepID=A0AAD4XIC6_9MAGN|nr:hypothetical protein MKW98_021751 [Papaver atlanticum]
MEYIQATPKMLLLAAHVEELDRFKRRDGGKRAIHHDAFGGRVNVLKYLIEDMKDEIDVKDGSGKTPLFHAAIERRLDAVEYLLEMGANPEIPDDSNRSPLHYVAGRGHKDVISLLLSKGINVDVIDDFGAPLQYAAVASKPDTIKVLLDHGANVSSISLVQIFTWATLDHRVHRLLVMDFFHSKNVASGAVTKRYLYGYINFE